MAVRPFFDTNVLLYAFRKDDTRGQVAETLLAAGGTLSVQENPRRSLVTDEGGLGAAARLICPGRAGYPQANNPCGSLRLGNRYRLAGCDRFQSLQYRVG